MKESFEDKSFNTRFETLRNFFYHDRRLSFFNNLNIFFKLLLITFLVSILFFVMYNMLYMIICASIFALFSIYLKEVLNIENQIKNHEHLSKVFMNLHRRVDSAYKSGNVEVEIYDKFYEEMMSYYEHENVINKTINDLAHNDALYLLVKKEECLEDYFKNETNHLKSFEVLFGNFIDFKRLQRTWIK